MSLVTSGVNQTGLFWVLPSIHDMVNYIGLVNVVQLF
jgi:hypothetical protein